MLITYAYEFSRKQPLTDHLKKNSGMEVGGVGVLARDIITIPVGRGGCYFNFTTGQRAVFQYSCKHVSCT